MTRGMCESLAAVQAADAGVDEMVLDPVTGDLPEFRRAMATMQAELMERRA